MYVEKYIRKLARSSYWQRIFKGSKQCYGMALFENDRNFSGIQSQFLYWLETYSLLYTELYSKEWINLDEEILKDDIRCDAFIYWRGREQEKEIRKNKEEMKKSNRKAGKKDKSKQQSFNIFQGAKDKAGDI